MLSLTLSATALATFRLLLKAVAEPVDRAATVAAALVADEDDDAEDDEAEMVAVDPADDACVARIRISALACDALERIAPGILRSDSIIKLVMVSWS